MMSSRKAVAIIYCICAFFVPSDVSCDGQVSVESGHRGRNVRDAVCDAAGRCECVDRSVNLAIGATVDSPDGLEQDWCIGQREGCRDSWAADGILDTYWDEMDQQEEYRLQLALAPENALIDVAALAITAFSHYRFAPRTWVIFCDNTSVAEVTNAIYEDNRWEAYFSPRKCAELDLVITEAYGGSPAIREVEIYGAAQDCSTSTSAEAAAAAVAAAGPTRPALTPSRGSEGNRQEGEGGGERKFGGAMSEGSRRSEERGQDGEEERKRGGGDVRGEGEYAKRAKCELLLPENVGEPKCGHLAGITLSCIARDGSSDECGALRLRYLLYNPFDVYFAVAIELYGEWSEIEMTLMRRFIHPGNTVVEAGVHIGSLTIPFAQLVGASGRVVGFEPQRVLYQMAAANVAVNGLWNVQLHNSAVGNVSSDAQVLLPMVQYEANAFRNFGGLRLGEIAEQIEASVEYVKVGRLDDLALNACHLLKVDTEGYEEAVLAGAAVTIELFRPAVYFEDNEHSEHLRCPAAARTLATHLGYMCWKHIVPYFNPANYRKETVNYFQSAAGPSLSYMILCLYPGEGGDIERFATIASLTSDLPHLYPLSCSS